MKPMDILNDICKTPLCLVWITTKVFSVVNIYIYLKSAFSKINVLTSLTANYFKTSQDPEAEVILKDLCYFPPLRSPVSM